VRGSGAIVVNEMWICPWRSEYEGNDCNDRNRRPKIEISRTSASGNVGDLSPETVRIMTAEGGGQRRAARKPESRAKKNG
jgi:hypothetical protein